MIADSYLANKWEFSSKIKIVKNKLETRQKTKKAVFP
jgi:hypothetical protein